MSVDRYVECGDEERPFSGVTNYSRLWRKGGGKRGLECGSPKVILKGGHGVFNMCNDLIACCAHESNKGNVVLTQNIQNGTLCCHVQQWNLGHWT